MVGLFLYFVLLKTLCGLSEWWGLVMPLKALVLLICSLVVPYLFYSI